MSLVELSEVRRSGAVTILAFQGLRELVRVPLSINRILMFITR
jgi:hypothetical protein